MELTQIAEIRYVLYAILLAFVAFKVLKWLMAYTYRLSVINKMKGLPIIPFIGNAHQFKRKYGKDYGVKKVFID